MEKQKRSYYSRILPPTSYSAKGLSLLSSMKVGNALEQASMKEKLVIEQGRSDLIDMEHVLNSFENHDGSKGFLATKSENPVEESHLPYLTSLKSMKEETNEKRPNKQLEEKLKMFSFIKDLNYFQKLTKQVETSNNLNTKNPSSSSLKQFPAAISAKIQSGLSDKILFQSHYQQSQQYHNEMMTSLSPSKAKLIRKELDFSPSFKIIPSYSMKTIKQPPTVLSSSMKKTNQLLTNYHQKEGNDINGNIPFIREITNFSTYTNMKYMRIGDAGAFQLANVLLNDPIIVKLTLATARISDEGIYELSRILPTVTKLKYLDLSSNSFGDEGAIALSEGIINHHSLRILSVAGNRIGLRGIVNIASSIVSSHINQLEEEQGKNSPSKKKSHNRIIWCR
jgi:hypothetical protein